MKRSRHTPEQIAFALRQAGNGLPVVEVCRKMGIAEQTFHRWKKKYDGIGVAELKRHAMLSSATLEARRLPNRCCRLGKRFTRSHLSHSGSSTT